jgi:hypothetical protein
MNIGTPRPFHQPAAAPVQSTSLYQHLAHIKPRIDRRTETDEQGNLKYPSTALSTEDQYKSIAANARPKGAIERRQISPLEAATTRPRLDLTGDAMPTQASIAALLERLDSLQAIHARLDKLDAAIAQLSARVETLDGNAVGAL